MYKKPSKRQQLLQRVVVLTITVISVLIIVTGSILFILGYRFDGKNGIEQGALVQFDSLPTSAQITIDDVTISSQTPNKRTLVSGVHVFQMSKAGFKPWQKTLDLAQGTLTWLDYVRLVPENADKETVRSYSAVSDVVASADMQAIAIQQRKDRPSFDVIDIRERTVSSTTVSIPTSVYSAASSHTFTLDVWDDEGRYVLVQHDFGNDREWIVVDTVDAATSINITRLFDETFQDIQFAGTSGNVFYGLSDGVVRKLDLSSSTISSVLARNVKSFSMYEDNLFTFIGVDDKKLPVAGFYRDNDRTSRVLYTAKKANAVLRIDTARHYNDNYIALSDGLQVTVYKGSYPSSVQSLTDTMEVVETFSTPAQLTQLNFSPGGDYVFAQAGLAFASYEVEYDRLNQSKVETSETAPHPLSWLDGAHLWTVYDGHMSMRDFDGTNVHVIMPMEYGFDATLSQNGRYIYGVNKTDDTYRLERFVMLPD